MLSVIIYARETLVSHVKESTAVVFEAESGENIWT
jgi:hypothetical protein